MKKITLRFFCCVAFSSMAYTAHSQTWKQLDEKVTAFYSAGNIDSALFYANKELAQAETEFGKTDSNYFSSLDNLGVLYGTAGNYAKAEEFFLTTISVQKKTLGSNHPNYATSLNNLGALYLKIGEYTKAEPLFVEALSIRKKLLGPEHPDYTMSLNDLAILYQDEGAYPKAEPLLVEALAIRKKILGPENPEYATSLDNLADLYKDMGIYPKAELLLVEALTVRKKVLGTEHTDYALSLNELGRVDEAMGNYAKAEPLYLESLLILKKNLGEDNIDYASVLNNLANLYEAKGDYAKAEPLFVKALPIFKKEFGEDNRNYSLSLNNLAYLYQTMGIYTKAEPLYVEALAINKKVLGLEHPEYAGSLNNLALLYQDMGLNAKAEPLFVEALTIRKKILGLNHPDYAKSLSSLAQLYEDVGDYEKAKPLFIEALAINKKALGEDHPDCAKSLNNLASLYKVTGNYAKAESLYLEALSIVKKALGPDHPDFADYLNNLANLYVAMGLGAKAEPLYLETKKIVLQNINRNFGFLSEVEKEKYLASVFSDFNVYHSFLKKYCRVKPSVAADSYDIELVTKGMILSSGIQLRQTIQANGDKDGIELFDHWIGLKNMLAKLYTVPIAKRQLNTDSIENLATNDEKELTRLSSSFRQGKLLTEANWTAVQQALRPNEVAIEFASFQYYDSKRWTDTTLYTALVLRKHDPYPTLVNLCRQDQLNVVLHGADNKNSSFITNLYRGATVMSDNTSTATRQKLYKLVWKPMEKFLHPGDHIYYAPSGSLHQVAFAAIPREDGKLLSDRYNLTQLSSTVMLLQHVPAVDTKNLSIAAFGGIKYDASTTELASVAVKNSLRFVSRSLISDSTRGGSFYYLPGTLTEITSIDSLAKVYHVSDTLYTGINATEESYKRYGSGPSPRIIHIATHGFFLPDPKKAKQNNAGLLSGPQFQLSDNPLNRAGLAFAGANHAWKGEATALGMEDGILTAYEASNVPLSSTELVVLSACETGLGDIRGSEGVFGLQRAFKAAGATYVMMSLWQVPDKETAEFMKVFYKNLFSGHTIENAFNSSQNTMKNKYRDDPYKWAAFVLLR